MELISDRLRLYVFLATLLTGFTVAKGQRTIGLLANSDEAFPGYTLFAPAFSRDAFLIDQCGYLIKKWTFPTFTLDMDLLPDGRLLRTSRATGYFTGGGAGGRVELYDWDGNLTWGITLADSNMQQHHEAQMLPNGHILTVVWYKYSQEEATQKGFKPEKLTVAGIWSDRILEIKPLPNSAYEIIWEWDFWDHTIQDINPAGQEYGVVAEHPELLDVNFYEDPGANPAEWLHVNALDYHQELDQILISSKYHNEIYIIDHSTTREEAKGHTGGTYGKGGDFLYRWGNPRSYRRGSLAEHWLFGQHDVQWIQPGLPGAGNILLFNNGSNRIGELYSTIDEISTPDGGTGIYPIAGGERFEPKLPVWMYTADPRTALYSSRISGVQRLPNGNTLICEGNKGNFIEVSQSGKIVWQYRNPVSLTGPNPQGSTPSNTDVFRIDRYSIDYPAFAGKNLMPAGTVELNSAPYDCRTLSHSSQLVENESWPYPNPTKGEIYLNDATDVQVFSALGRKLTQIYHTADGRIDLTTLPPGAYILKWLTLHRRQHRHSLLIKE